MNAGFYRCPATRKMFHLIIQLLRNRHRSLFFIIILGLVIFSMTRRFDVKRKEKPSIWKGMIDVARTLHAKKLFCRPKTHVGFLKTHKTGSTTIFNILARMAIANNIPVVTPPTEHLCPDDKFEQTQRCMMNPEKPHSMLFNHAKFSETTKNAIPSDSYWFTILREPLGYFESIYEYYKAERHLHVDFNTFMGNHTAYLGKLQAVSETSKILIEFPYLYSLQSELGLSRPFAYHSSSDVIKYMERNFQLVIVSTYFDEGLCYLRSNLCWSFSDIVYFEQNQRSQKRTYTPRQKRRFNAVLKDVIPIYMKVFNHFEWKFREHIMSSWIKWDVEKLRDLKRTKREECLQTRTPSIPHMKDQDRKVAPKFQPVPLKSFELKSNSSECLLMALPEEDITNCLKLKELGLQCDLK